MIPMSDLILTENILRRFSPLNSLKRENIAALAKKMEIRSLESGKTLLREGDTDKRTYYLVSGTLELADRSNNLRLLRADSADAHNPITPLLPRRYTVKAVDHVEYLSVDTELLDVMLTWDQTGSYEVNELQGDEQGGSDDWMTTLLQTRAFHRIPPANIQAIFMRMQKVNYNAGDVIIKQGEEGDYFYVIKDGAASVMQSGDGDPAVVAYLVRGDSFGEDALLSNSVRNASVTMMKDGKLMRLGKSDFSELLKQPTVEWLTPGKASILVRQGAGIVDVRLPEEFDERAIKGAIKAIKWQMFSAI